MAQNEVAEYLRGLDIKQVRFGGFDQTQVFENLKKLSDMYEDIIEKQKNEYEKQIEELQLKLEEAQQDQVTVPEPSVVPEPVLMQPEEMNAGLDVQKGYEDHLKELAQAIDYMSMRKRQIEEEGKQEKERILADAKIELDVVKREKALVQEQVDELHKQRMDDEQLLGKAAENLQYVETQKARAYQTLTKLQNQLSEVLAGEPSYLESNTGNTMDKTEV